MGSFTIKEGDTRPSLAATLSSIAATLVGATASLVLRNEDTGVVQVNSPMVIVDPSTREVRYDWADGDTDTPGNYRGEIVIVFADLTQETFPPKGCFFVEICPR